MSKQKILLVDDDPDLVKVYKTKFDMEGYETLVAGDGQAGLALAKKAKPDLMILDMMMPKLSGLEFLAISRKDPGLKNIPIIMLSNQSDTKKIKKAQALGAKAVILKINHVPSEIVAIMKKYLKT